VFFEDSNASIVRKGELFCHYLNGFAFFELPRIAWGFLLRINKKAPGIHPEAFVSLVPEAGLEPARHR